MAYYNKNTVSPFDAVFDSAAKSTGLRYDFLRNIAQLESGYRADARPPVDKATGKRASSATGVMQLIKGTGAMYGLNTDADFLDPNKNINAGAKYLAQMLKLSKGDEMRAALAYHSGPGSQDIKNYDAGNYGAISKWGQDYLRKVNGTAQGGQHASDYYSSNTPKPEVLGDIHQDTSTTPANSNANAIHQLLDTPDAVPSVSTSENYSIPQADTSRDVEYANQHFGQNQAEYDYNTDSTSTMHGTGAAVENALGNSVVGTFGRAWQTQGFGAAVNTLRPAMSGPIYDDEFYKKLEDSNLDPKYYSMMDGINPNDFDKQLAVAQENQRRDEELAAKNPGFGASLIGTTAGMAGDPTFYLTMPFGGEGALAKWADGISSTGMRLAAKTGLRMGVNATQGVASDIMKTHITGGDKDVAASALSSVLLGEVMHGAHAGVRRIRERVQARNAGIQEGAPVVEETHHAENINSEGLSQTETPDVTITPADAHVSAYHEQTHVDLSDNVTSHARRLEMQEGARNHGVEDPTLLPMNGNERFHEFDNHSYHVQEESAVNPDGTRNPLSGQAHDSFNANGQRMDGASPHNPHTRWQSQELDAMTAPRANPNSSNAMMAANAWGTGMLRGMEDIGLAANKLTHKVLGELLPQLMSSPTGLVKAVRDEATGALKRVTGPAGEWFGGRVGRHSGDQILTEVQATDENHLLNMRNASKNIYRSPRYAQMGRDEANQVFGRRIAEALEDRSGQAMNQLSAPEKAFAESYRALMNDKHFQMTNTQRWGATDATSLIGDNIDPNHYFSVEWDARHINEFVHNVCGDSKETAVQYLKEGFLKDYYSSPETKADVNALMESEWQGSVEVKKRETAAKHAEALAKNAEERRAKGEARGKNITDDKKAYSESVHQQYLKDNNLSTTEEIQARYQQYYEEGSKTRKTDKARAAYAEKKVKDDLADIRRKAYSDANIKYNNEVKSQKALKESADKALAKANKLRQEVNAPLDPMKLKLMVEKHANDTAFGIIHQGEAITADAHAAILRAQNSNSLAGAGNSPMLKGRSGFGYGAKIPLPDGMEFSPNDLRNFDIEEMLPAYLKQANGHIAVMGSTGKSVQQVIEHINEARKEAKDLMEIDPAKAKALKAEVSVAENTMKLLLQRSRRKMDEGANDSKVISQIGRSVGDVTFGTHNFYFGLNNLGEIPALVAKTTVGMLRQGSHAIRDLTNPNLKPTRTHVNAVRNAMMGHEVRQAVIPTYRQLTRRWQDEGMSGNRARIMAGLQKSTAEFANKNPGTYILHKSNSTIIAMAENHAITEIMQDAHGVGKAQYLEPKHLNAAGLTPEQGELIRAFVKEHSVNNDGHIEVKDLLKFSRDDRAPLFTRLVRNASEEAIQKDNLNQMSTRPMSWWGSLLMQFSRFSMKSYARSFRWHHQATKNGRALDAALYTVLGSALTTGVYGLRVWCNSLTMPEDSRKQYLKTAFHPGMIAYNAITRNPITGGFLGPISTIASKLGYDPAKMVRSSITPPAKPPRPMDWSNPYAYQAKAGQLMSQAFPAATLFSGAASTVASAGQYAMADNTKQRRDALDDAFNASRQVVPTDPLTLALHKYLFKQLGADVDAKKH